MSRFLGILSVLVVLVASMGFAAVNAGHRVTIDLFLVTLYQVPVTLVAFSGLFAGMVVMFLTGIHTDLKVRRILRDRFAEESRQERTAIDKNQQDLFGADHSGADHSVHGGQGKEGPLDSGKGVVGGPDKEEVSQPLEAEWDDRPEDPGNMQGKDLDETGGEPTPLEEKRQSDLQQSD